MAPCEEEWPALAAFQAVDVFAYDMNGEPQAHLALEKRVDYLDAYCRAVNAALGQSPSKRKPWWHLWGKDS